MRFSEITLERIVFYLAIVGSFLFTLWKTLPPFIVILKDRRKEREEAKNKKITEAADVHKFHFEQLRELYESVKRENEHKDDVIIQLKIGFEKLADECRENEERELQRDRETNILLTKKHRLLRELRRDIETAEYFLVNKRDEKEILKILADCLNKVDEYEKLLG